MTRTASVLALAALAALAGCVERKMVIRSDPPQAMLTLDGQPTELATPAEIPFLYGGVRRVELSAPGCELLETTATLADPWYENFPLDLFAEVLWPGTIHDVQTFDYKLRRYQARDVPFTAEQRAELAKKLDELKLRAERHRAGGSEGPGGAQTPPAKGKDEPKAAPLPNPSVPPPPGAKKDEPVKNPK